MFFHLLTHRDITNGPQHVERAIKEQRAQANVYRKLAAIFASPIQFQARAHRAGAWGAGIPLAMMDVDSTKTLGQQGFQHLTFEFGASVPKHFFSLAIHAHDAPTGVDQDQCIR
jgi:hypothetical protein